MNIAFYIPKELRRLRRALWLARANRADSEIAYWTAYGLGNRVTHFTVDRKSEHDWLSFTGARRLRLSEDWIHVWNNVKQLCINKAEEYK